MILSLDLFALYVPVWFGDISFANGPFTPNRVFSVFKSAGIEV